MSDEILNGIQETVNRDQPGWAVSHYAVVVGLEHITADGIETGVGLYMPDGQPDYVTEGLLAQGERLRDAEVIDMGD
jgi:hypothetical protein